MGGIFAEIPGHDRHTTRERRSASERYGWMTKVPSSSLLQFRGIRIGLGYDRYYAADNFFKDPYGMASRAVKKSPAQSSSVALFARNFLKHPWMLGSVIPSSPFLVNDLLRQVDWERARVLVEYGPGVGTITKEILKRMRPDATLIAIELNDDFVAYLGSHVHDSRLRVVHGSAAHVRRILAEQGLTPADYIISGLPYSIMPDAVRRTIVEESRQALEAKGSMLLFQYTRILLPCLESYFSSVEQDFQLFNILPALIFHCTP
jgi:phospholipid N-methyltransferase